MSSSWVQVRGVTIEDAYSHSSDCTVRKRGCYEDSSWLYMNLVLLLLSLFSFGLFGCFFSSSGSPITHQQLQTPPWIFPVFDPGELGRGEEDADSNCTYSIQLQLFIWNCWYWNTFWSLGISTVPICIFGNTPYLLTDYCRETLTINTFEYSAYKLDSISPISTKSHTNSIIQWPWLRYLSVPVVLPSPSSPRTPLIYQSAFLTLL